MQCLKPEYKLRVCLVGFLLRCIELSGEFPLWQLSVKQSQERLVAKLLGSWFACLLPAGPSSDMQHSVTFDRLDSASVSRCETWLASHVCKRVCTCASASSSSLYLGYGYDILISSVARSGSGKGSCSSGIGTRLSFSYRCCSGFTSCVSSVSIVVFDSGVGVCSDSSSSSLSVVI